MGRRTARPCPQYEDRPFGQASIILARRAWSSNMEGPPVAEAVPLPAPEPPEPPPVLTNALLVHLVIFATDYLQVIDKLIDACQ